MRSRRFAGILLFALGFGSAVVMRIPSTQAASREGVVEGNLKYILSDRGDFQLIYSKPNKSDIYVAVGRNLLKASERRAALHRGKITFVKEQRKSLTIFRLTPVMRVTAQFSNPCGPPELCPFPPDPEPPRPGPRPFGDQEIALDQYNFEFLGPDLARQPGF